MIDNSKVRVLGDEEFTSLIISGFFTFYLKETGTITDPQFRQAMLTLKKMVYEGL